MPVEQGGMTGGRGVPHPNSAAGQALTNAGGMTGGSAVPHPNSAAGQALTNAGGMTGGSAVPHPNSAAGQELANKNLEEKTVLEGGTQVKPWLKNQPDLAAIRNQNQQNQ
ncbi:Protein CBG17344 [Caenorhabditis briggsae]|nr:Protein CBG17344 [Caenorhabditis briggsae]CAP35028.2 Protein CBG17344 [Caenorhabditis briggsae]